MIRYLEVVAGKLGDETHRQLIGCAKHRRWTVIHGDPFLRRQTASREREVSSHDPFRFQFEAEVREFCDKSLFSGLAKHVACRARDMGDFGVPKPVQVVHSDACACAVFAPYRREVRVLDPLTGEEDPFGL